MNARLRDKRSSLAMTSLALCLRQAASAFCSSGRALRLPLSTSVNSSTSRQGPPLRFDLEAWHLYPVPLLVPEFRDLSRPAVAFSAGADAEEDRLSCSQ
jgi:hypothetical protein